MTTLIVYDSLYGNTEKIARAIAGAIAVSDEAKVLPAVEANLLELASTDLLIVGSPTQGGRPTPAIQGFLDKIPANSLQNVSAAAFDTRFSAQEKGLGMRILLQLVGYAAGRIAASLKTKGASLAAPPEGFIVEGKEVPLKTGEMDRAADWALRTLQARRLALPA